MHFLSIPQLYYRAALKYHFYRQAWFQLQDFHSSVVELLQCFIYFFHDSLQSKYSFHPILNILGKFLTLLWFSRHHNFNWGSSLCTSVYYKPTDSHSYLYSSSHLSHVKNSIPFSWSLRLCCLYSDDSNFSEKLEVMCQLFW